jgi:hypothetical protein
MANATAGKILYVKKVGDDGWMQARVGSNRLVPLAKYTKVTILASTDGRTSFKVMDGPAMGQTLSMADRNVVEYLGTTGPTQSPATIVVTYGKYTEGWVSEARGGQKLDQQLATLQVSGITAQVTMNSVWDGKFFPLPAGEYSVLVPDAPHNKNMTRFYRTAEPTLRYDQVWFPIKVGDNSRYVHVGNLSDGCTTVLDLSAWAKIEEALISHRSLDGRSVAKMVVKGTPERLK